MYTLLTCDEYKAVGLSVQRDHIFEVQCADHVFQRACPWSGEVDEKAQEIARSVVAPYLNGHGDENAQMLNLNNTDSALNQYWKGVSVRQLNKEYSQAEGDRRVMAQRMGFSGDASDGLLAAHLRETMREAVDGAKPWKDAQNREHGHEIRARYQPNWVRNVDRAIGTSGRFLQGRLEEQDGDQTSEQLADVLRDYLRAMGVSGGP